MEIDKTLASIQDGWVALSALAITYSLSVLGAIVLIVVGYIAAGLVERAPSDPWRMFNVHVEGTRNVCEAMRANPW